MPAHAAIRVGSSCGPERVPATKRSTTADPRHLKARSSHPTSRRPPRHSSARTRGHRRRCSSVPFPRLHRPQSRADSTQPRPDRAQPRKKSAVSELRFRGPGSHPGARRRTMRDTRGRPSDRNPASLLRLMGEASSAAAVQGWSCPPQLEAAVMGRPAREGPCDTSEASCT